MKKITLIAVFISLVALAFAATLPPVKANRTEVTIPGRVLNPSRTDTVIWEDNFESGLNWTPGYPAPSESWSLSPTGAYAGNSWWMHNPVSEGYTNNRYIVLDTPVITLPAAAPQLSFRMSYLMEAPAVYEDYNGWDGFNVRISTDGGDNWTVITPVSPAYSATSFFSFGDTWGEGVGVPAWGGNSSGWQLATFNLATYAGQNVKIRFAFASDVAACTTDGDGSPSWFGVRVDDINVADVFLANGDGQAGDNQLVSDYLSLPSWTMPTAWEISSANSVSPTHSLHFSVTANALDYITSPSVTLPALGPLENLYLSYQVLLDMLDSNGDADDYLEDFYRIYIKGPNDADFVPLHYAYYGMTGLNPTWTEINNDWANLFLSWQLTSNPTWKLCDLSSYAGQTVQLQFLAICDDNDDGGVGTGLWIDDVKVIKSAGYLPPVGLTAVAEGQAVNLNWTAPLLGQEENVTYYDATSTQYIISDSQPYAVLITNSSTETAYLKNVLVRMGSTISGQETLQGSLDVTVYANNAGTPGDVLYQLNDVTGVRLGVSHEIDISAAGLTLAPNAEVFVAVGGWTAEVSTGSQGILCDTTIDENNNRSFCYNNNAWTTVTAGYTNVHNLKIGATLLYPDPSLAPTSYKVYRTNSPTGEYAQIGEVTVTSYVDAAPQSAATNYYAVTAVYNSGEGESDYSGQASAYVASATSYLLSSDDGTMETAYTIPVSTYGLVKFDPMVDPEIGHATVLQVHIYVSNVTATSANAFLRIWDNTGTGGNPGNELLSMLVESSTLSVGWNDISLSAPTEVTTPFYVGIRGSSSLFQLGLDTDTTGSSYIATISNNQITSVAPNTAGNLMFRALVDRYTDANDTPVPAKLITLRSYPNPFNPIANINFNLPKSEKVSVKIYNIRGQLVTTLVNNKVMQGENTIQWHGTDASGKTVASGIYFSRLETPSKTITNKMLMLK